MVGQLYTNVLTPDFWFPCGAENLLCGTCWFTCWFVGRYLHGSISAQPNPQGLRAILHFWHPCISRIREISFLAIYPLIGFSVIVAIPTSVPLLSNTISYCPIHGCGLNRSFDQSPKCKHCEEPVIQNRVVPN